MDFRKTGLEAEGFRIVVHSLLDVALVHEHTSQIIMRLGVGRPVAERLAEQDIAVWDGNYYAVEMIDRLGLGADGAVRAGIVHYNTAAEVDRLLEALRELV